MRCNEGSELRRKPGGLSPKGPAGGSVESLPVSEHMILTLPGEALPEFFDRELTLRFVGHQAGLPSRFVEV